MTVAQPDITARAERLIADQAAAPAAATSTATP